jgi:quinoprotein glucose dehydrogenase
MMRGNSLAGRAVGLLVLLPVGLAATPAGAVPPPRAPQVADASAEPQQAAAAFALPAGLAAELFAAEPQVANPAALSVENAGRVFVAEVFRARNGVTDNRQHDDAWLDADLASRTVADRIAYHRRLLGSVAD